MFFYKCNSKCKRLKIIWNVDKNFIPHGLGLEKLDFIKKLLKNKYKNLNLSKYEKFKNMIDSKEITDAKILNFLKNKTSKKEQKNDILLKINAWKVFLKQISNWKQNNWNATYRIFDSFFVPKNLSQNTQKKTNLLKSFPEGLIVLLLKDESDNAISFVFEIKKYLSFSENINTENCLLILILKSVMQISKKKNQYKTLMNNANSYDVSHSFLNKKM